MGKQNNELIVRQVDFNGSPLMATQDPTNGKIYVGVSWVCNGIGFSKGQKDRQVENIQQDLVLNEGCRKFAAGVFDPNNETLAIEIDYLPLWLAKISITPRMKNEQPRLARDLIRYQLKAKDVLAEAFIYQKQLPRTYLQALKALVQSEEEILTLETKIEADKPLVDFAHAVGSTSDLISVEKMAKLLFDEGYPTGRNKYFSWLRDKGYLTDKNLPYQKYIDAGYFRVKEVAKDTRYGVKVFQQTMITGKGQLYLAEKFRQDIQKTVQKAEKINLLNAKKGMNYETNSKSISTIH